MKGKKPICKKCNKPMMSKQRGTRDNASGGGKVYFECYYCGERFEY